MTTTQPNQTPIELSAEQKTFVHFDEMVWPATNRASRELEWYARYGSDAELKAKRFEMASVIQAYHALISKTNKRRNYIANRIKKEAA